MSPFSGILSGTSYSTASTRTRSSPATFRWRSRQLRTGGSSIKLYRLHRTWQFGSGQTLRLIEKTRISLSQISATARTIISHRELVDINRSIVRCAEDTVFYRDDLAWVRKFIARNRDYRIESPIRKRTLGKGTLLVSTHAIAPFPHSRAVTS